MLSKKKRDNQYFPWAIERGVESSPAGMPNEGLAVAKTKSKKKR